MNMREIMSAECLNLLQDLGLDPAVPMMLKEGRRFHDIRYYKMIEVHNILLESPKLRKKFFIVDIVGDYQCPQYFDGSRCLVRVISEEGLDEILDGHKRAGDVIGLWTPIHWITPHSSSRLLRVRGRIIKKHETL